MSRDGPRVGGHFYSDRARRASYHDIVTSITLLCGMVTSSCVVMGACREGGLLEDTLATGPYAPTEAEQCVFQDADGGFSEF